MISDEIPCFRCATLVNKYRRRGMCNDCLMVVTLTDAGLSPCGDDSRMEMVCNLRSGHYGPHMHVVGEWLSPVEVSA